MARQLNRLSAKRVENEKRRGRHADGNGLYLQITESGCRSWLLIYELAGRERYMGLGPLSEVSLKDARELRDEYRKLLRRKIDPITHRNEKSEQNAIAGKTFRECAEEYLADNKSGWRNKKHIQQWENSLPTYVYEKIGDIPVSKIDVNHVLSVLQQKHENFDDTFWKSRTETANRVRGRIEVILDWAAAREYRQGENPARWRGKLDKLLPRRSKIQKIKHHPALPYQEIGDFVTLLRKQPGMDAKILEFVILTGARTSEATGATWEEINIRDKIWVIPANRMKAGKEHRVPLSARALAVLQEVALIKIAQENGKKKVTALPTGFMFTSVKRGKHLSNMAMLALLRRLKRKDITTHGFRSTFRDWAAEQTNYPREVAEAALAHTIQNKVEAAYRRGDLFEKRRKLMNAWAEYCAKPSAKPQEDNVLYLQKRRRTARG